MIHFKKESQKGECLKLVEFSLLVKLRYTMILEMEMGKYLEALVSTPPITLVYP